MGSPQQGNLPIFYIYVCAGVLLFIQANLFFAMDRTQANESGEIRQYGQRLCSKLILRQSNCGLMCAYSLNWLLGARELFLTVGKFTVR